MPTGIVQHALHQTAVLDEERAERLRPERGSMAAGTADIGEDGRQGPRERNLRDPERREVLRKAASVELKDPLGPGNVLEPVLAEVAQLHVWREFVFDDCGRRAGQEHLATVRRRAEASGAMHSDADVPVFTEMWLGRMKPHSHVHPYITRPPLFAERTLRRDGCSGRIACLLERDEERVPLRVDFGAAVLRDRGPQEVAMTGEHIVIVLA
jgi:hypothetical protein